jgi:hypothetical protein
MFDPTKFNVRDLNNNTQIPIAQVLASEYVYATHGPIICVTANAEVADIEVTPVGNTTHVHWYLLAGSDKWCWLKEIGSSADVLCGILVEV